MEPYRGIWLLVLFIFSAIEMVLWFMFISCPAILAVGTVSAGCLALSSRIAVRFPSDPRNETPAGILNNLSWEKIVSNLRQSLDPIERSSIFLGVNAFDGTPVIVPRSVYKNHAHFLGDSGSGKTSLGISTVLSQLIRFGDASIVVLDLKGDDLALFENVRIEAENTEEALKEAARKRKQSEANVSYPFRWLTSELGLSTYCFNPLTQRAFRELGLYQRADVLLGALGLQYGTDYGRSFFSDANTILLYQLICRQPHLQSFRQLRKALEHKDELKLSKELRNAASHLEAHAQRLAAFDFLNSTPETAPPAVTRQSLDFADLFRRPQAVFFQLPASQGTVVNAQIARLALYSLLGAAKYVGTKRIQVYLFIDEFQRIVARNVELVLQTARSMNIGVILANQALSDLNNVDANLISTVRTNTRCCQMFSVSDVDDQRSLVQSSGETILLQRSWSEYLGVGGVVFGGGNSRQGTEQFSPRLRLNDVLLASDHPYQSILHLHRGAGYAQYGGMPLIITSVHHIDEDTYKTRRGALWPPPNDGTILSRLKEDGPQPSPASAEPPQPDKPSPTQPSPSATPATPIGNQLDEMWDSIVQKEDSWAQGTPPPQSSPQEASPTDAVSEEPLP